jgi:hypothetical protein
MSLLFKDNVFLFILIKREKHKITNRSKNTKIPPISLCWRKTDKK